MQLRSSTADIDEDSDVFSEMSEGDVTIVNTTMLGVEPLTKEKSKRIVMLPSESGDADAVRLAKTFDVLADPNCVIEVYSIESVYMTAEEVERLCDVLRTNASVRALKLTNIYTGVYEEIEDGRFACDIYQGEDTDTGLRMTAAIGELLVDTRTIQFLNLSRNLFGDESARNVAEGLRFNKSVRRVKMNGCHFRYNGDVEEKLVRACKGKPWDDGRGLTRLDF